MHAPVRPLLKWAGGKRQLLPALREFYPPRFDGYIEPFFGSGAVFFDLWQQGLLTDRRVVLIDSNPDLIGCYEMVRDDPERVAAELDRLADGYARGGRDHYYRVRDRRFNPVRTERRTPDGRIAYTPALAAMLIYLNRTGFNGLFRVNAEGAFNVPAGRYDRPRIVERDRLRAVADALAAPNVSLRWGSFADAAALAAPGDFLYADPPYAPLSDTARFTAYTALRFGDEEQRALQQMLIALAGQGCHVLMSNSTAPLIADLYEHSDAARAAGLRAWRVPARRAINSNASRRGPIDEYVITNIRGTRAGVKRPRATRTSRAENLVDETTFAGDS
jgi:DNA adenine methylase